MDALKHFDASDSNDAENHSTLGEATVVSPISNDSDADYESAGEANDSDWEPSPSSKKSKNGKTSNGARSGKGPIPSKAGTEEGKGIQQGSHKTPKKALAKKSHISQRPEQRKIVRWSNDSDITLLLAFVQECDAVKSSIPWGNIARHISDTTTESAIRQHLVKLRQRRIEEGLPVPGFIPALILVYNLLIVADKGSSSTGAGKASPKKKAKKAKNTGKKAASTKKRTLVATEPDSPATDAGIHANTNASQYAEEDASTAGESPTMAYHASNFPQQSTLQAQHPSIYSSTGLNNVHNPFHSNAAPFYGSYNPSFNTQHQTPTSLVSPFQDSLGSHHQFTSAIEGNYNSATGFGAPYASNAAYNYPTNNAPNDYSNINGNVHGGLPRVGVQTWQYPSGSDATSPMGAPQPLPAMTYLTSPYQGAENDGNYFSMGGFNGNADERNDGGL
ncbi:MAG: hypothetical protein Q9165_004885 [Trypethelium subeluteriae]